MNVKTQFLWLVVLLSCVTLTVVLGGCATTETAQRRVWIEERGRVGSASVEVIINSEPPGAEIYSVQGEHLGRTPLSRIWRYEKFSSNYHVGNEVREVMTYVNASNSDERYLYFFGSFYNARDCMLVGPGHPIPGSGPSIGFQVISFSGGMARGCPPSPIELNFSFIAQKPDYERRVHTVTCGQLQNYEDGRLRSPCRRTVFLQKTPGTDIDLDLRLKMRQPK